LPALQLA